MLDCCGVEMPDEIDGYPQVPLDGVSMRYTFDADGADAPQRPVLRMLGTRGIWQDGWKAVAVHGPTSGIGNFDEDEWELYHVDEDRAEATTSPPSTPSASKALVARWFEEAEKYDVLPLDDRRPRDPRARRPQAERRATRYVYYPDTAEVPESAAVNVRGRSSASLAEVELTSADAEGVIFAHGSRFGGHALFLQGPAAALRLQLPRHPARAALRRPRRWSPGGTSSAMEFAQARASASTASRTGPRGCTSTTRSSPKGRCAPSSEVHAVRRRPVRRPRLERRGEQPLQPPASFKGGTIVQVEVNVGADQYLDLEKEAMAALARE